MGIFDSLGRQMPIQPVHGDPMRNMRDEVSQISSNPSSYLKGKGYTIPDGMTDAKQITQYLLQSGQIGVPKLQKTVASLFGPRK